MDLSNEYFEHLSSYSLEELEEILTPGDLELYREFKFLKNYIEGAFTKNPDGSYSVDGSVDLSGQDFKEFPFRFKTVTGDFNCGYCINLQSLQGSPTSVGEDFSCSGCSSLQSLQGAPESVGRDFYCSECLNLRTLQGAPKSVGAPNFIPYPLVF